MYESICCDISVNARIRLNKPSKALSQQGGGLEEGCEQRMLAAPFNPERILSPEEVKELVEKKRQE